MEAAEFLNRGVRDRTRALIGWCAGVAAYIALLAAIFPSIEGSADLDELIQDYPEALKSLFGLSGVNLTTGPGYVDTELFNLMLPLLAIVLAIGSGSRTLAGEEEAGRLELLFAYPVRRRDGVVAKGLAVGIEVAIFAAVVFLALAVLDPVFGLDLPHGRLAGAVVGLGLLAIMHGWLALAVGAARPSRALAIAVPAGFAAFGYLVGGLHDLAGWLDPFRVLSSFWWIGQSPLSTGIRVDGMLVVGAAAVVALVAAALLIERRDLEVP
jgi:ABC-2 type transport system permease protein